MPKTFTSVSELISEDERSPMDSDDFDGALWLLLSHKITSPADAANYPRPAVLYVASRYLQWDVGNGGFAQAVYNIPEWFPLAAEGYQELNKPSSTQLIRKAIKLLPENRTEIDKKGLFSSTVGQVFEYFRTSKLVVLDACIVEGDWYIDEERVAYVRRNRDVFRRIQ